MDQAEIPLSLDQSLILTFQLRLNSDLRADFFWLDSDLSAEELDMFFSFVLHDLCQINETTFLWLIKVASGETPH